MASATLKKEYSMRFLDCCIFQVPPPSEVTEAINHHHHQHHLQQAGINPLPPEVTHINLPSTVTTSSLLNSNQHQLTSRNVINCQSVNSPLPVIHNVFSDTENDVKVGYIFS